MEFRSAAMVVCLGVCVMASCIYYSSGTCISSRQRSYFHWLEVINDPNVSPNALENAWMAASKSGDQYILQEVAKNPKTPRAVLDQASQYPVKEVRDWLAANPALPPDLKGKQTK